MTFWCPYDHFRCKWVDKISLIYHFNLAGIVRLLHIFSLLYTIDANDNLNQNFVYYMGAFVLFFTTYSASIKANFFWLFFISFSFSLFHAVMKAVPKTRCPFQSAVSIPFHMDRRLFYKLTVSQLKEKI